MLRIPLIFAFGICVVAEAQQPNCTGIARDVDARCACVKDPSSKLCDLVRKGFYDTNGSTKMKPLNLGLGTGWAGANPAGRQSRPIPQTARPQQARVVPLPSKDYLRFLHPDASVAAGFDFGKLFRSPEVMQALLGTPEGPDDRKKLSAALQEM